MLRFNSVQKLSLERMAFITCLIELVSIKNTLLTNCTFQNALGGGAVRLGGSTGNVSITFQINIATSGIGGFGGGGAVGVYGSTGDVSITYCTFQNNSAVLLGGSTGDVSITYCTFQNNSATYGGGAVKLERSKSDVRITNCTFQNNSATRGVGGAVWLYGSTGDVSITYCTFQNNSATHGGAVMLGESIEAIFFPSFYPIIIYNSSFTNNNAVTGAAVYANNGINFSTKPIHYLHLQDVVIKDNHCSGGGAIYFVGMMVDIFGSTPTGSQFLSNSGQGAIQGQNGYLLLYGNITFTENRGVNGGAISLSNNAPLFFLALGLVPQDNTSAGRGRG